MKRTPETIMQDYIDAGYVNTTYVQTISCGAWGSNMVAEIRSREDYYRAYFAEHGLVAMITSFIGQFAVIDAEFLLFRREEEDYYALNTGIDGVLAYEPEPIKGSEI